MSTLSYSYQPQDPTRRYRGMAVVLGLHALLAWALLTGTAPKAIHLLKKPLEAVVIQEVLIPPVPLPPPPKEIHVPEPLAPKSPTPMPVQPDMPTPSANLPMENAPELPPPTARPAPAPAVALVQATAQVDTTKAQAASMEGEYVAKVRAMLDSTKRYPTGRQASQQRPQGKVKVWFTLARNGMLVEAGVLESSNANLLDDAALGCVRRGSYPPFPEHTWPGQGQHKFTTEIEFAPPSGA